MCPSGDPRAGPRERRHRVTLIAFRARPAPLPVAGCGRPGMPREKNPGSGKTAEFSPAPIRAPYRPREHGTGPSCGGSPPRGRGDGVGRCCHQTGEEVMRLPAIIRSLRHPGERGTPVTARRSTAPGLGTPYRYTGAAYAGSSPSEVSPSRQQSRPACLTARPGSPGPVHLRVKDEVLPPGGASSVAAAPKEAEPPARAARAGPSGGRTPVLPRDRR